MVNYDTDGLLIFKKKKIMEINLILCVFCLHLSYSVGQVIFVIMEEFEYSVEISDGDWQNFFAECEACNLLSPPLAHVDDSGMSDMDDMRSMLAKKAQIPSRKEDLAEAYNPPSYEGSPVEHFISKHGIGGFESVLSGSEEDIHLQSVNVFFESLKKVKKTDSFVQPRQEKTRKVRLAIPEQEQCSDGQKSISNSLPNKLNSRAEARSGPEDRRPVDMSSSINTTKDVALDSSMSAHPALSESVKRYNKPAHCKMDLIIKKDASTETEACGATQWSCFHDRTLREECTGTIPNTAKETKVQLFSPLIDTQKKHHLTPFANMNNSCLPLNLQTPVLHIDTSNIQPFKTVQPELSPSASIKRKRRKKRRLSFEPPESPQRCETRVLVWPSDSEEEQCTRRGRNTLGVPDDINLLHCREPQKNIESTLFSLSSNLPVMTSAKDWSPTYVPENKLRQESFKPTNLAETNSTFTSVNVSVDDIESEANRSDRVATSSQESISLDEITGQNKLSVSVKASTTYESDETRKTTHMAIRTNHTGHQESDLSNGTVNSCNKEQNLPSGVAEVKSITDSVPPCTQSADSLVGSSQNDRLSEAKSVLAPEAGNCVGDNYTLCHSKAESQQQLKIHRCDTDQFCLGPDRAMPTDKKLQESKIKFCPPSLQEISRKVMELHLNSTNSSTKHCVVSDVNIKNTEQEAGIILGIQTKLTTSPLMACEDTLASETTNNLKEDEMSTSNDLTSLTDVTPMSSCCTLHTESVKSLSNENITDLSGSFCSSVCQTEYGSQGLENLLIQVNQKDISNPEPGREYESPHSSESKSEFLCGDIVTTSKDECESTILTDSKHSVFAMSSFWSEMEKLTINDILGLRKMSRGTLPITLPTLQEVQEADMFATTDSGTLALLEETSTKHESPYFVETADFPTSKSVIWESKPLPLSAVTDIFPENSVLTCASDTTGPVLSESVLNGPRRISKKISVQNLRALQSESFNSTWKGHTSQTFVEEDPGNYDKNLEDQKTQKTDKMDSTPVSLIDSYIISITDILRYLFGGKQLDPSQTSIDSLSNSYTEGHSVPEMYDHFFSEFDTESFFYRPIPAEDQAKDKQVPIFSYSRSASRDLHFPEAYDCFFPSSSSSSDESSESGEEDNCGPVKVVSRLSRKTSTSWLSTDVYEHFYTDNDHKQNFFWNPTFSFRNIKYSGSTVQTQQTSNSLPCIPMMQSDKILQRTLYPTNVLGNHDMMITRHQVQHPFRYEDLKTTVSNPSKCYLQLSCT